MKGAKIFIVFTFLLAFTVSASAQEQAPKIVWKSLQEKYERFEDIKPSVLNTSNQIVYLDSYYRHYIHLLKFYEQYNQWIENPLIICGTLSKAELKAIEKENLKFSQVKKNFSDSMKILGISLSMGTGFYTQVSNLSQPIMLMEDINSQFIMNLIRAIRKENIQNHFLLSFRLLKRIKPLRND